MKVIVNNEHLAKTLNVKVGATVEVETKGGVPTNKEWRNRLKDATIDGCVTIVKPTVKKKVEDK